MLKPVLGRCEAKAQVQSEDYTLASLPFIYCMSANHFSLKVYLLSLFGAVNQLISSIQ